MINFCDLIKQQPLWFLELDFLFGYRMLDNLLKNHVKMWRYNTVRSANLSEFFSAPSRPEFQQTAYRSEKLVRYGALKNSDKFDSRPLIDLGM